MLYPGHTTEEIAWKGRELYERELRREVEAENAGRFLVVDVESGDYEVADEDLEASERLLERRPEAKLYGLRIGEGAASASAGTPPPAATGTSSQLGDIRQGSPGPGSAYRADLAGTQRSPRGDRSGDRHRLHWSPGSASRTGPRARTPSTGLPRFPAG